MMLLTKEVKRKLPPLYGTEATPTDEKVVVVKFFTPDAGWTWYAVEGSPIDADGEVIARAKADDDSDWLFFGLVDGFEKEWGYFTLNELKKVRGAFGLPVERDRGYTRKVKEIR
jgi:hypothetical protein